MTEIRQGKFCGAFTLVANELGRDRTQKWGTCKCNNPRWKGGFEANADGPGTQPAVHKCYGVVHPARGLFPAKTRTCPAGKVGLFVLSVPIRSSASSPPVLG